MNTADFKILIIDDDPDIGNILKMTLDYKGFSTVVLNNAVNCQNYIKDNEIRLIIMDLLISGVYGVDVCSALKADVYLSAIPVIMMSAHPDAKRLSTEAGANDFLAKPFDMAEVIEKVNFYFAKYNNL